VTPPDIIVRDQTEDDFAAVHELVIAAFKTALFTAGTEQFIMDVLWRSGAATVALVAEDAGVLVGQAAFSKVLVAGKDVGWHGCGPVSIVPDRQRQGIGSALMRVGLDRLHRLGSKGCVLVGHPDYYPRFGFVSTTAMFEPGVPPEAFMALAFSGPLPEGQVDFDEAFKATG
jgi:predicted N-acetyltransferase YhbS